jgi:hypothetical protein
MKNSGRKMAKGLVDLKLLKSTNLISMIPNPTCHLHQRRKSGKHALIILTIEQRTVDVSHALLK